MITSASCSMRLVRCRFCSWSCSSSATSCALRRRSSCASPGMLEQGSGPHVLTMHRSDAFTAATVLTLSGPNPHTSHDDGHAEL